MIYTDGYAKWVLHGRKVYKAKLRNTHGFRFVLRHCKTATQAIEYGHRLADRFNRMHKEQ